MIELMVSMNAGNEKIFCKTVRLVYKKEVSEMKELDEKARKTFAYSNLPYDHKKSWDLQGDKIKAFCNSGEDYAVEIETSELGKLIEHPEIFTSGHNDKHRTALYCTDKEIVKQQLLKTLRVLKLLHEHI